MHRGKGAQPVPKAVYRIIAVAVVTKTTAAADTYNSQAHLSG